MKPNDIEYLISKENLISKDTTLHIESDHLE